MKFTTLCLLLMSAAVSNAAPTIAGLTCTVGLEVYINIQTFPHENGCALLQCQFGQVVPIVEACGKDVDGQCHTLNSAFEYQDKAYRCTKQDVGGQVVYTNTMTTPVYDQCQAEGQTFEHLQKFQLSDGCRRYQCQDGNITLIEAACGKDVDGQCHLLDSWFIYNEKVYNCRASLQNGETVYINAIMDPQPSNNKNCILGGVLHNTMESFLTNDGCKTRQCQNGAAPYIKHACTFAKEGGTCKEVGSQWIYDGQSYTCSMTIGDNGLPVYKVDGTIDIKHKCKVGETWYNDLDLIVSDDGCKTMQCQDGQVPYIEESCNWQGDGQCHSLNSVWETDGVARKCIINDNGMYQVVRLDEDGNPIESAGGEGDGGELPDMNLECPAYSDFIFVLDSSGSITELNYRKELQFCADIASFFPIGPNDARFGAVIFSGIAQKLFDLKDHDEHDSIEQALLAAPFLWNTTATDKAFNLVIDEGMFSAEAGGRDQAQKILIIVTDGVSDDPAKTLVAATRAKDMGIQVMSVGVGTKISDEELEAIASSPEDVFKASRFELLTNILMILSQRACDVLDSELIERAPPRCDDTEVSPCEQICSDTDDGYVCSCQEGFAISQENSAQCDDINECADTANPVCEQICTNSEGSYECTCNDGYTVNEDDTSRCDDIDECSGDNPCQQICANSDGSFECSCQDGYVVSTSNPNECEDVDECSSGDNQCAQICTNSDGSYECSCNDGYVISDGDSTQCDDIDECTSGAHQCDQICTNSEGSYECYCEDGYVVSEADSNKCEDVNECLGDNPPCQQTCTNLDGSYECSCRDGYKATADDSSTCEDINECAGESNPCEQNCVNSDGSFECTCEDGYVVSDTDPTRCDDVDECVDFPCQHNCTNFPGSFECTCLEGYVVAENDSTSCEDINECDNSPCENYCTNTEGSYECTCRPGYVPSPADRHKCEDDDECADPEKNKCEHICVNTVGYYECSCREDYIVSPSDSTQCDLIPCPERIEADLVFLFDSSGSIGPENYNKTFRFAGNIVDGFTIGPENVRVGAMIFSYYTEKLFDLKDYSSHEGIFNAFMAAPYMAKSTYTDTALAFVGYWDMFGEAAGGRTEAIDVLILITDGKSNRSSRTINNARNLKSTGIIIMCIGIGDDVSISELTAVASDPDYVFLPGTFDAMQFIEKQVEDAICDAGSAK